MDRCDNKDQSIFPLSEEGVIKDTLIFICNLHCCILYFKLGVPYLENIKKYLIQIISCMEDQVK